MNENKELNDGIIIDGGEQVKYFERVYEYSKSRQYDQKITELYKKSQIEINGVPYKTDKFFITYKLNSEDNNLHLINVENDSTDILLNSNEKYEYDRVVRFKNTTAFINLINSDCTIISFDTIVIIDINKAIEIIKNWDGMIHNKVAETDAMVNKNLLV